MGLLKERVEEEDGNFLITVSRPSRKVNLEKGDFHAS